MESYLSLYLNLRSPSTSCGNTWNQPSPWPNVENAPPTDLSSPRGTDWYYDTPILPTLTWTWKLKASPFPKKQVFSKLHINVSLLGKQCTPFVQTDLVFPMLQLHPPNICFYYVQHMFPYVQHVSPYSSILSNRSLHIVKSLKCCFHILWVVFFEFNSSPAQLHYHCLNITPLYPPRLRYTHWVLSYDYPSDLPTHNAPGRCLKKQGCEVCAHLPYPPWNPGVRYLGLQASFCQVNRLFVVQF